MKSPYAFVATALFLAGLPLSQTLGADETAPPSHGKIVKISGDVNHFAKPGAVTITGTDHPDAFASEVFGKNFTVTILGLDAGTYTIEIDLAETYAKNSGQRVIEIECNGQKLAEHLDLVKTAGFGKAYRVTGTVEHLGDALRGPLTIKFTGTTENAKFNAITILDSKGQEVVTVNAKDFVSEGSIAASRIPDIKDPVLYTDPKQPTDKRVNDLIRRMSLAEKVGQLQNRAPEIARLGVAQYDYWNEALHGVARAGTATVFPQAIGLAATWDDGLIHTVADAISTEARAIHQEALRHGDHSGYRGLTLWSPNINIFRDPRWGRGQETYGEDPWLTSRIGVAFIEGLQGNDPKYLKTVACAKHFAVHSGPEAERHRFDARPPERDLYETYLPQFEAAVREAHVGQVMSAYNAINGVPAPADKWLLTDLLRTQWGFDGFVVSDCDAVADVTSQHHFAVNKEQGVALSLQAGNDLNCGSAFSALTGAVDQGLVKESEIDTALQRVLTARFRLGMFDPPTFAYAQTPFSENASPAHSDLALKTAREAMVLLKNDGVLPLDKSKLKRIAVIGANADDIGMLYGNYNGTASNPITILKGIQNELGTSVEVTYAKGCPLALKPDETFGPDSPNYQSAMDAAKNADVVIYVGGISPRLEGEEMQVTYAGFSGGDRLRIELPPVQEDFLKALQATGKPVIYVNCSGSAIAMPWEAEHLSAILQAWYPGENGGTAVADILFGNVNPAGRLPVTFYRATEDLPDFRDYSMANRTYRYFTGAALFPFGYGLSYTKFAYSPLKIATKSVKPSATVKLSVDVKNTGERDGEEVVQLYVKHGKSSVPQAIHSLVAFKRVMIAKGKTQAVALEFPAQQLRYWSVVKKSYVIDPGEYELQVGASSSDVRSKATLLVK